MDGQRDIIVVGTSAGGVEALTVLMGGMPSDLPAAIFVVLHIGPTAPRVLPQILARASRLRFAMAEEGEPIEKGRVYIAPPDHHLLLSEDRVHLNRGPRENGHRPAVDTLFRSAANTFGERVVGVVLTGMRNCGTAGLMAVKRQGGVAIVQDPEDALFADMPRSARDHVDVDHCVPLAEIAPLLVTLSRDGQARARTPKATPEEQDEPESEFTCPGCGGNLRRNAKGDFVVYYCKVGHRYTPEAIADEQSIVQEDALWVALRTLEDSVAVARKLAARAQAQHQKHAVARYEEKIREAEARAELVRRALMKGENLA